MKDVLIVGSGGREHALAWKLSQSKGIGEIFVAPGNAGTSQLATNIPIAADDIVGLLDFAKGKNIHLTIVGPDNTLSLGIVDLFIESELRIFGPTKKAAEIEWSKTYAKDLMKRSGIPTAEYATFSSLSDAKAYVKSTHLPLVVKADGLALGKGVFICNTEQEAIAALNMLMGDKEFGNSGSSVVIEEYLEGREVSAHAICDGTNFVLFPLAQDHKRISEGNTGPNTGGMGTICPVPEPIEEIKEITARTLFALKKEGRPFSGCLFPGIILTKKGPKVLEFNARFGDPETQVYMSLLKSDLLELLDAAVDKRLNDITPEWDKGAAASIVLASEGYPNKYPVGLPISGIEQTQNGNVTVFHAGTKISDNQLVTSGGRVLNIVSTGKDLDKALTTAYSAVEKISFKGKTFRKDIGFQYTKQF